MPIPNKRLKQIATIRRKDDTDDFYGDSTTEVDIYTDVKCRVTRNKHWSSSASARGEGGYLTVSTHLIFINVESYVIKTGDIIVVNGERFSVEYADSIPGGVENHHYQIYCRHGVSV